LPVRAKGKWGVNGEGERSRRRRATIPVGPLPKEAYVFAMPAMDGWGLLLLC